MTYAIVPKNSLTNSGLFYSLNVITCLHGYKLKVNLFRKTVIQLITKKYSVTTHFIPRKNRFDTFDMKSSFGNKFLKYTYHALP